MHTACDRAGKQAGMLSLSALPAASCAQAAVRLPDNGGGGAHK